MTNKANSLLCLLILIYSIFLIVHCTHWTSQMYPNPQVNFKECGNSKAALICDPDHVLSQSDREILDKRLEEVSRGTYGIYTQNTCQQKGLTVYIALAKNIQASGRTVSERDMSYLANGLKNKWVPDYQCKKGLIIVLSTADGKFWATKENNVPISDSQITHVFANNIKEFKRSPFTGLLSYLNGLEQVYQYNAKSSNANPNAQNSKKTDPKGPKEEPKNGAHSGGQKQNENQFPDFLTHINVEDAAKIVENLPQWLRDALIYLNDALNGLLGNLLPDLFPPQKNAPNEIKRS